MKEEYNKITLKKAWRKGRINYFTEEEDKHDFKYSK
jgi:hypothetical protein